MSKTAGGGPGPKQNKRFVIVRVEVRAGANWDGHQLDGHLG